MSAFLGCLLTIITCARLVLPISFFFSLISITNLSLDLNFAVSLAMAKLKRGINVVILFLIVFVFPEMFSFGNITPLLSSLTFVLPCLPPLFRNRSSQIFLLQMLPIPLWTSLSNHQIFFMFLLDRPQMNRWKMNRLMTSYPTLSLGPLFLPRLKIFHKTFHLIT